ncbi:large conductance mechanosensitive channel protein MscL [Coriobacteriaceae bacterium]|uniref:large conductance mechanosensitive channel protein MscL n=1 Tax=Granulimonas faecalis TaxID=2894155 RepID=UPI001094276B|nr:large conductance mechanosensitive channel protein MscL [Coriobacteriaceae bacterium]
MAVNTDKVKEKSKGFIAEFKEFISRGSVIDLAVGMIIGAAFTAIVNSLVNDIVMPLIGVIIGGIDFSGIQTQVGGATIMWGNFIQAIINFLLIALVVFLMVKCINTAHNAMSKKAEQELEEEVAPEDPATVQVKLLEEIRDALIDRE